MNKYEISNNETLKMSMYCVIAYPPTTFLQIMSNNETLLHYIIYTLSKEIKNKERFSNMTISKPNVNNCLQTLNKNTNTVYSKHSLSMKKVLTNKYFDSERQKNNVLCFQCEL